MADVDFFWDPVCPWAWITSRWVEEVAGQRSLDVDWRFIALRIVNEEKYATDFPPGYADRHQLGLRILRVASALRDAHGRESVGPFYTAVGTRIHVEQGRDSLGPVEGIASVLEDLGLPSGLAKAADDDAYDGAVRMDTEEALARAGSEVGTPIVTFAPPDGPSFFGPVINRIPRGEEAVALWDAVETVARFPGFSELKRTVRGKPQTS